MSPQGTLAASVGWTAPDARFLHAAASQNAAALRLAAARAPSPAEDAGAMARESSFEDVALQDFSSRAAASPVARPVTVATPSATPVPRAVDDSPLQ